MSKDESESGDGFEEMHVDHVGNQGREQDQETDDEEGSTPQPLEDGDNGTTTDEESVLSHAEPEKKDDGVQNSNISNGPMFKDPAASSPRRELPSARRVPEKKEVQSQLHQAEDDVESTAGETDDDELWQKPWPHWFFEIAHILQDTIWYLSSVFMK